LEDGNLYLRLRTMSHTIYAAKFKHTIIHNMYFDDEKVSHTYIYHGKVSCIDGAAVTIILGLHVLIARRI